MNIKKTLMRAFIASLALCVGSQAFAARTTTFYHNDGMGSVVAATNATGQVLWRKDYAPYGEQIDTTPDTERQSYTGKQHDEATGLTYFGARDFDPEIGRFMSTDPVGFLESNPLSFNRYCYANNNPYKFVDADGRLPIFIPIIFGIVALMGADAANAPGHGDVPEPQGAAAKSALMQLAPIPGSGLVVRQSVSREAARTAATRTAGGTANATQGARLAEHLRQVQKYGSGGFKDLANGRTRYYGQLESSRKAGEMVGRRLVREWDPATGAARTWHETLDAAGRVRIVRPETGGPKIHYLFDEAGNYAGSF